MPHIKLKIVFVSFRTPEKGQMADLQPEKFFHSFSTKLLSTLIKINLTQKHKKFLCHRKSRLKNFSDSTFLFERGCKRVFELEAKRQTKHGRKHYLFTIRMKLWSCSECKSHVPDKRLLLFTIWRRIIFCLMWNHMNDLTLRIVMEAQVDLHIIKVSFILHNICF